MPQSVIEAVNEAGGTAPRRELPCLVVLEVDPDRRAVIFPKLAELRHEGARVRVFEEPMR